MAAIEEVVEEPVEPQEPVNPPPKSTKKPAKAPPKRASAKRVSDDPQLLEERRNVLMSPKKFIEKAGLPDMLKSPGPSHQRLQAIREEQEAFASPVRPATTTPSKPTPAQSNRMELPGREKKSTEATFKSPMKKRATSRPVSVKPTPKKPATEQLDEDIGSSSPLITESQLIYRPSTYSYSRV